MENLFIFFMIFMFFLGVIQLIWALIHPLVSKNKDLRRHFGYYWLGVLGYAIGMVPAFFLDGYRGPFSGIMIGWCVFFFFAGAWTLAIYHLMIVIKGGRFGKRDNFEDGAEEFGKYA